MLQGESGVGEYARRLRKDMSLPERLLWARLRLKPQGMKFRRQHPSGPFVADFYCHESRLVIEIDGNAHDMGNRPIADVERDAWFHEKGLRVIHIPASDVLANPDDVASSIVMHCTGGMT